MSEISFEGRVIVVTGAARGMGKEVTLLLAGRGASVVVNDLGAAVDGSGGDAQLAESVVSEIRAMGGEAIASGESVATEAAAAKTIGIAIDAFGRLDGLVNNAGNFISGSLTQTSLADVDALMNVHHRGTLLMCRAAWPYLVASGSGRIVNLCSHGMLGDGDLIAYAAAKGAVFGLTRSVALTGAVSGVKANMVAPTAATRMMGTDISARERRWFETAMPPGSVAPVVALLAHSACSFSGELLGVGGGVVNRLFVGETQGYLDRDLTIESVHAHIDEIFDMKGYEPLASTAEAAAKRRRQIELAMSRGAD
ncbi:MAG: SDR family NAD(P)-dependent oxidoreductase [Gammaproteobacteria bacterium]|nr:SDR family NAD(P)-dependent oxidoreductase [Gammaproteobacteria bacterium]